MQVLLSSTKTVLVLLGVLYGRPVARRTGRNIRVVFDSGLFGPLYENMTSSTKPEVHNILHCRQSSTDPRPRMYGKFSETWTCGF